MYAWYLCRIDLSGDRINRIASGTTDWGSTQQNTSKIPRYFQSTSPALLVKKCTFFAKILHICNFCSTFAADFEIRENEYVEKYPCNYR